MSASKVIVLGASGGIGSETCRRLRIEGAELLLVGRDPERTSELAAEFDSPYRVIDARSADEVEDCIDFGKKTLGQVDAIVHCIGSVILKPAHLTSLDEWRETIDVNLTSAFATIRAGYRAMRNGGGSIVLMSSAAARIGLPNHEAIAAAKAGVIGLMQSAAATYASRGLRVNAVAPGLVMTGMTERIWSNEKAAETSRGMHALGRLGKPADIASLIVWLLQPDNDWITGQVFGVDGGLGTIRAPGR